MQQRRLQWLAEIAASLAAAQLSFISRLVSEVERESTFTGAAFEVGGMPSDSSPAS